MRNLNCFSVGMLVATVLFWLGSQSTYHIAAQTEKNGSRWEYATIYHRSGVGLELRMPGKAITAVSYAKLRGQLGKSTDDDTEAGLLNAMADDGWELVISAHNGYGFPEGLDRWTFKRQK